MSDDDRGLEDAVDLQSLDLHTIQELKRLIHGYPETDASPHELSEYHEGKSDGLNAVMGLLTHLESEIEDAGTTEEQHDD